MKVLQVSLVATLLSGGVQPAVTTHVVRLDRNRFTPPEIHARAGDTIKFVNGEGGPHNVEFLKDSIAPAARELIEQAMGPKKILPLSGPLLIFVDETYTFVVPNIAVGRYPFLCSPHWASMRGALNVQAR